MEKRSGQQGVFHRGLKLSSQSDSNLVVSVGDGGEENFDFCCDTLFLNFQLTFQMSIRFLCLF